MEVEDVSAVTRWVDVLMRLKTGLESNDNRKGETPTDRMSREQLIRHFIAHSFQQATLTMQGDLHKIHSSFVALPYLPCNRSLNDLEKMSIKDLTLETHHRTKYLLLKAVTPPNAMTAVMMIMEDELDEVVGVHFYQQETWDDQMVRDIFQVNRICIVKEPYFKIMADGSK